MSFGHEADVSRSLNTERKERGKEERKERQLIAIECVQMYMCSQAGHMNVLHLDRR